MYLDSGYAKPIGSFRYPVPVPIVDPDAPPVVCVAINQAWIAYVAGACKQLLLQTTWNTADPSALALVQERVFNLISQFGTAVACMTFAVRQDPLDSCLLDFSTDGGTTWTPFADISLCVDKIFPPNNPPGHGQPGQQPGGGAPTPAQCFDLDVTVQANGQLFLPYPITDGWTVKISIPTGTWTDNNTLLGNWFCYDGHVFYVGSCTSGSSLHSTDPLPSSRHMALILVGPNGALSPLTDGLTYTVPNGTGLGSYGLQCNDNPINDNVGSITCHVHICSPAGTPLTCGANNLTLDPRLFANTHPPVSGLANVFYDDPFGTYVVGKGFKFWAGVNATRSRPEVNLCIVSSVFAPMRITGGSFHYSNDPAGYQYIPGMQVDYLGTDGNWGSIGVYGDMPGGSVTHILSVSSPVTLIALVITGSDYGGSWASLLGYIDNITLICDEVTVVGIANCAGSPPATVVPTTPIHIGDTFTYQPQFGTTGSCAGHYDGGFTLSQGCTIKVIAMTGDNCAGIGGFCYEFTGQAPSAAPLVVGATSNPGCTGFTNNSTTAETITFQVISIP